MIKNYRVLAIIAHILCVSTSLLSMTHPKNKILTVALFDPDRAVLGTDLECVLFEKATQDKVLQIRQPLEKERTYNVIPDKKNLRIGICNNHIFTVYDIQTLKRVWWKDARPENYSAAFSPVDGTIFFYQNEHLSSNTGIGINLACVRSNPHIGIECHPKKKELLYLYSNRGLAVYSFVNKTRTMYYPKVVNTDTILRALYSPEGDHIALLTDTHKIFIYNPITKSTIPIPRNDCLGDCFSDPIFIPNSTAIAFLCNYCKDIHCWDFKKRQLLVKLPHHSDESIYDDTGLINRLDFSDDGTRYLCRGFDRMAKMGKTDSKIINHINDRQAFLRYCLLKIYANDSQNILPLDIIRLFIEKLRALYEL
jgi:WD40 repeat protein